MYGSCPEGVSCRGADECAAADALREWFRLHHGSGLAISSTDEAVICADTAGRIHYLNQVCAELTGYRPEDLTGSMFSSRFTIVDEGTCRDSGDPLAACLASGALQSTGNDDVLVAEGGRQIPLAGTATPIRGADGTLLGAIFIFRDATPTRRLMRGVFGAGSATTRSRSVDEAVPV